MSNKWGIPKDIEEQIRSESKGKCAYCGKKMIPTWTSHNRRDSPTIEHLREVKPFYWKDGLKEEDMVICCGSCNSSRGKNKLKSWFETDYCKNHKPEPINEKTVTDPVREYLKRNS